MKSLLLPIALVMSAGSSAMGAPPTEVVELSISDVAQMVADGRSTSVAITRAYFARVEAMDQKGVALHAVISINPEAIEQAKASDLRRSSGHSLGLLDGVPILIKDNIETKDPIATTAGSLALINNVTGRDAPVVAALRAWGAVILGKTNLSEWANARSKNSMSGWSGVGGLVKNPYVLDRTACGSSSGSAAAVAASFAAAAIGTETTGSLICPSSMNGLVGLKPTRGLVSNAGIVPISRSQDSVGPMGRNVRDVAILLTAMVTEGRNRSSVSRDRGGGYNARLSEGTLKGVRLAILHPPMDPRLAERYERALAALTTAGAVLVSVDAGSVAGMGEAEFKALNLEMKGDLAAYLKMTAPAVKSRSIELLIAFDRAHSDTEMPWFGQDGFEGVAAGMGVDDPEYRNAKAKALQIAMSYLDGILRNANADIIVEPTLGPAWISDPVRGDQYSGPGDSIAAPAIAGYPHLTVPMGLVEGLPVGLSFIGRPFSEASLLSTGYAYEQISRSRIAPTYKKTIDVYAHSALKSGDVFGVSAEPIAAH
jgi:amidase